MNSRIILTGARGCGKTTVGKLLAHRMNRPLFDTDELVESAAQKSIRSIFEQDGEAAFRKLESEALTKAMSAPASVIATGGGCVIDSGNRDNMQNSGFVVWLTARPETMQSRIARDESAEGRRPNLTQLATLDEIKHVFQQREPLYRSIANLTIDTDQLSPEAVVSAILAACSNS